MKTIFYNNKKLAVPEIINGKRLLEKIGIKKNRTAYTTDLDGNSKLVSDGKQMYITDGMQVGDIPQTEKG